MLEGRQQEPSVGFSSVGFLWCSVLPHDHCYEGSCGESHTCRSTSVTQSHRSLSLSDTDRRRAAASAPPLQAAGASIPEAGSSCSGRDPCQQTAGTTQKEPSSHFQFQTGFRCKLRTYQDDDPHRVVGEQQQAEGNEAEAHGLVRSCGLETKQRSVHRGRRLWKLQTARVKRCIHPSIQRLHPAGMQIYRINGAGD